MNKNLINSILVVVIGTVIASVATELIREELGKNCSCQN